MTQNRRWKLFPSESQAEAVHFTHIHTQITYTDIQKVYHKNSEHQLDKKDKKKINPKMCQGPFGHCLSFWVPLVAPLISQVYVWQCVGIVCMCLQQRATKKGGSVQPIQYDPRRFWVICHIHDSAGHEY